MRNLFKRDERVVTTRGYLLGQSAMNLLVVGAFLSKSELPEWVPFLVVALALAGMVWCFANLWDTPQPLEQDQPETQ